jgi:hypothetical protein
MQISVSIVLFILQPSEITEIVHSMNSTNICVDKAHNTETTILGGNNTQDRPIRN